MQNLVPVKDEDQKYLEGEEPQIQPRDSAISSASYLTYKTAISENDGANNDQTVDNHEMDSESCKKQELQDLKSKLVKLKEGKVLKKENDGLSQEKEQL